MPTVGWILEDAIERFWEAQPAPVLVDSVLRVFPCERCGEVLASAAELRTHYSLKHPLELPGLYVRGEPLLRESAVRASVVKDDIELVQCTQCKVQVDGGSWSRLTPHQFRTQFSRSKSSLWNVVLLHDREVDSSQVQVEYQIRFRIPDKSSLNVVDENFVRCLATDDLTHDHLARFQAALPQDMAAREYGAALGDYALGIFLKERHHVPHSQVGFEQFARCFRTALEVLRWFDRPVAAAVCGSIRLSLNDFRNYGSSLATEVEPGLQYFRSILAGDTRGPSSIANKGSARHALCPIDDVSHLLLTACLAIAGESSISSTHLETLNRIIGGPMPVSEQDLAKMHVICADGYLRLGRHSDAQRHLAAIQFDPVFNHWARGRRT